MKRLVFKGGEGSGNRGHAGRPGQVGGSKPSLDEIRTIMANTLNVAGDSLFTPKDITDAMATRYAAGKYSAAEITHLIEARRLQQPVISASSRADVISRARDMLAGTLDVTSDMITDDMADKWDRGVYTNEDVYAILHASIEPDDFDGPAEADNTVTYDEARRTLAEQLNLPEAAIPDEIVHNYVHDAGYTIDTARNEIAAAQDLLDTYDTKPADLAQRATDEAAPLSNDALEPYAAQLIARDFPIVARNDNNGNAFITVHMSNNDANTLWNRLRERGFAFNGDDGMTFNTSYGIFEVYRGDTGNVAFHAMSHVSNLTDAEWARVRTNVMDKWMYLLKQVQ